ncbi:MAG: two-component system, sensor histidine kinase PdtaS [Actinomycetota bacterium]|nr:two-component system, sensor histidine kinase PdtaS [Actinomycetota bacterium]
MPSLQELAGERTGLGSADLDLLHGLLADWMLLADLSFADLVLWLPLADGSGFVAGAQVRPTTGPTVHHDDVVGTTVARGRRPQLDTAYDEGRICRERDPDWADDVPVREETIPVRRDGRVIAVVSRHTNLATARTPSRLELTYLRTADDLALMVAEGRFPSPGDSVGREGSPRVGDGLVRLDEAGLVTFASPNALSAYRRLGLATDLVGAHLGDVTARLAGRSQPADEALSMVVSGWAARQAEVEAAGATVRLRVIPLVAGGVRTAALVLCRDVTELRRRERELVGKDVTIREIHHRVKNNLQTVAALLRLQSRRLAGDDQAAARHALEEAERRVGSIALVHETLSRAIEPHVPFDDVADRVVAMVGLADRPVRVSREGSFGDLPPEVATPMALVLVELVQNAVQHGLADGGGEVVVRVERSGSTAAGGPAELLRVTVTDDGGRLPVGFDPAHDGGLGLQIVRALVQDELGGRMALRSVRGSAAESAAGAAGVEALVEVEISPREPTGLTEPRT